MEDPTVDRLRNSYIYHPSKFQLDSTVQTPGTFQLVHHFLDLFSARERTQPEFIFLMNGISDILFEGSFVWGIVFCSQTYPTNFKVFSNMIFTIASASNQPDNVAPRLLTCTRYVVALLSELNFFGSSSRQAEQEFDIVKDKIIANLVAPQITQSRHTGIAAQSLHQAGIDHVTSYDLHRHGRTVASSSRCPSRRTISTPRLT